MNKPFISIIIPTFNRAHLIERSVSSVLEQTYRNFELIVVDDCSTDNTKEVVEAMDDPRIRYVRCERNGGAAAARNRGIAEAKYDWIAFQDSDDAWRPGKLEKQVAAMDGVAGMIYCSFLRHESDGTEGNILPSPDREEDRRNGILFGELLLGNFISTQTVMIHKKILQQAGLFNEKQKSLEDYELFLRVSQVTRIRHVNEVLVDVYATEGSVGLNVGNYAGSMSYILAKYKDIYEEIGLWDMKKAEFLDIMESAGMKKAAEEALEAAIREVGA